MGTFVLSDKECDGAKEVYLQTSPGKLANLAACIQSCQDSDACNSITFYSQSKWCSHFFTACDNVKTSDGATAVRFQTSVTWAPEATTTTTTTTTAASILPANAELMTDKGCDPAKNIYLQSSPGIVDNPRRVSKHAWKRTHATASHT